MSPPTVQLFDSMARWVGFSACLGAAVSALLGAPRALPAGFAALGAVALLVAQIRTRPHAGSSRTAADIATDLLTAGSVADIEAAVCNEIAEWDDVSMEWCVLTELVPIGRRQLPPRAATLLDRALARVPDGSTRPVWVSLPPGDVAIAPCGSGSGLVLAVHGRSLPHSMEGALCQVAALAGAAVRRVALSNELDERRTSARFEELVRFSSDAIFIVDAGGTIRYAAPSVTSVLGHWSVDVQDTPLADLVVESQRVDVGTFLANVQLQDVRHPTSVELRCVRADGSVIAGELTGSNLLGNEDVRGMVVTVRDVSARLELEEQLRHQAFHDALTGLANRALFRDRLDRAMRVRRGSDDPGPAVAFIDLDDFKSINDSLGHAAGDELLQTVAGRIQSCLRSADTAARLGGDEFAVLIEEVPDEAALVELIQRVVDAVVAPMTVGADDVVQVSASAGLATCSSDVGSSEDLLRHADMAMYRAKLSGKGHVARFEPDMHRHLHERLELTAELDEAIRAEQLVVHYQPIVDLLADRIVAVEALVRWPHPTLGLLEPGRFLDLAEETGLILPLGSMVLRRALTDLAEWHEMGLTGLHIAINVSPRQFAHRDFEPEVLGTLDELGVAPGSVVLELTEAVLADPSSGQRLAALAESGIRLALDDFGTGVSSLRTVQHLPLSQLKIDRAFVSPLREHQETSIARTIIDLADTLGADAVGEGIEHEDELRALRSLGCRLGQGRLFGAPAPAEAVLPMLVAQRGRPLASN